MANADIVVLGLAELPLIEDLFNQVFRPGRGPEYFERRLKYRYDYLILLAQVGKRPAGFALGYEIKPSTFYCWYLGVLQDYRQAGIAAQLMEAMSAWAKENGYRILRFECYNRHRPMLRLAVKQNFDIVGFRFDNEESDNLITMEQVFEEREGEE